MSGGCLLSCKRPLLLLPPRVVERTAFAAYLAFYIKATPSVSLRSTAPSGKEPREICLLRRGGKGGALL